MGVHILYDNRGSGSRAALYCSVTEWAFGPVFTDEGGYDAEERAESFLRWFAPGDPRRLTDAELQSEYSRWRAQETAQWKAEEEG